MMASEIDLEHFRQRLLARQEALISVVATGDTAAQTVELDQARQGRLSRMDALQGQAMSAATKQRRAQELQQIKMALQRIDVGDYGGCLDCGEPIARARLEFDPAVTRCIDCASDAEGG